MDITQHTRRILDAHYQKSDLSKITSEIKHLTREEKIMIHDVVSKYAYYFDVTLGTYKTKPLDM